MRMTTILIAATLGIAGINQPANAEEQQAAQVVVAYGDLDLTTADGAEAMLARIERAALEACGPRPAMRPGFVLAQSYFSKCQREATANALAQLREPEVDRAFAATTGRDAKADFIS